MEPQQLVGVEEPLEVGLLEHRHSLLQLVERVEVQEVEEVLEEVLLVGILLLVVDLEVVVREEEVQQVEVLLVGHLPPKEPQELTWHSLHILEQPKDALVQQVGQQHL